MKKLYSIYAGSLIICIALVVAGVIGCSGGGEGTPAGAGNEPTVSELPEATPAPTESCVPKTCADLGYTCGDNIPDECGGTIASCGTCTAPQVCDANNHCVDQQVNVTPPSIHSFNKINLGYAQFIQQNQGNAFIRPEAVAADHDAWMNGKFDEIIAYSNLSNLKAQLTSEGTLDLVRDLFLTYNPFDKASDKQAAFDAALDAKCGTEDMMCRQRIVSIVHAFWVEAAVILPWSIKTWDPTLVDFFFNNIPDGYQWNKQIPSKKVIGLPDLLYTKFTSDEGSWVCRGAGFNTYKIFPVTLSALNQQDPVIATARGIIEKEVTWVDPQVALHGQGGDITMTDSGYYVGISPEYKQFNPGRSYCSQVQKSGNYSADQSNKYASPDDRALNAPLELVFAMRAGDDATSSHFLAHMLRSINIPAIVVYSGAKNYAVYVPQPHDIFVDGSDLVHYGCLPHKYLLLKLLERVQLLNQNVALEPAAKKINSVPNWAYKLLLQKNLPIVKMQGQEPALNLNSPYILPPANVLPDRPEVWSCLSDYKLTSPPISFTPIPIQTIDDVQ